MIVKRVAVALVASLTTMSWSQQAPRFVPVENLDGHPPLLISWETVRREGSVVSLTYLLETPSGSNSIDLAIDCAARTYVTRGVGVYPETLPPGAVRTIPAEPPRPIGRKSTQDVLAKAVCK
jgi:hypothetical protein